MSGFCFELSPPSLPVQGLVDGWRKLAGQRCRVPQSAALADVCAEQWSLAVMSRWQSSDHSLCLANPFLFL